jgi:lipopolysaccharide/colanic/teichoic acid biosynthesis glycosyltransferase
LTQPEFADFETAALPQAPANGKGAAVAERPTGAFPEWREVLAKLAERFAVAPGESLLLRAFECTFAALVLLLTFPIMLLVALAIRLDTPGPVLFRQPRVGRGGRLFTFIKFRSLYADARQRFPHLYAYKYAPEEIEQLCFKVPNDPRVTRVGEFLRTTTLDELPNFWNVLTGDMALVGPRPEIPEMLPYYREEHLTKFSVRPGVTGLAQISGRGRLRFLRTAELDAQYVRNRSLGLDLRILTRTISLILRRDGAF